MQNIWTFSHNSCTLSARLTCMLILQGDIVASCDSYGLVKLWDVRTMQPLVNIDCGPHPANKVAFDSTGKSKFSCKIKNNVRTSVLFWGHFYLALNFGWCLPRISIFKFSQWSKSTSNIEHEDKDWLDFIYLTAVFCKVNPMSLLPRLNVVLQKSLFFLRCAFIHHHNFVICRSSISCSE